MRIPGDLRVWSRGDDQWGDPDFSAIANDPVRLLLETLPHIAFLIAPGGRAIFYNHRFRDYAGPGLGPTAADRTSLQHPEDRKNLVRARTEGAGAGEDYIVEGRLRRHDGVYRWHRIHNKPMYRDDVVVAWLGTAVDIHDIREANAALERRVEERTAELERSRERFRMLYDRTPMALQSVDGEARLVDVNDHWLELFGLAREEAIGRSPVEFMTPESARIYLDYAWPAMLASGGAVQTVEYRFRKRSGEVFEGRLAARGEFDAAGRFARSWSAIADITAEKRAQAELLHALKTEAIGQLASGVAHDFNNLLTAVIGGVELLRTRRDDAARFDRLLTAIGDAASRGAALTRQLLAFGQRQRLSLEPLDVNALIEGMREMLERTLDDAIRISILPSAGLWTVVGDRSQLELVILNLVLNARDAMPTGGELTISTVNEVLGPRQGPEQPDAGAYVTLSVGDTGTGMSAEIAARVFEPFFSTKPAGGGSGLGLPQVLGVAQQLAGGVRIVSAPGAGTRVMVSIPRASHEAAPAGG